MRKLIIILSITVLLLLLTLAAAAPYIDGSIFKKNYLALINNNSYPKVKIQLLSYQQGWLHSYAKLHVTVHDEKINDAFDVDQIITHGPLLKNLSTNKLEFLYGYVQSTIPVPKSGTDYSLMNQENDGWIQFDLKTDFAGHWSGLYSLPDIMIDHGNLQLQGFQGTVDAQAKANVFGALHATANINIMKINIDKETFLTVNQITFDTIINQHNAVIDTILTKMTIDQITLPAINYSINLKNSALNSTTHFTNNKPSKEEIDASVASTSFDQIYNDENQNVQLNNINFNGSYDFTKMPALNINYLLKIDGLNSALTLAKNSLQINAKSFSVKGDFSGNVAQQWSVSNFLNLAEVILSAQNSNLTLRGLKDSVVIKADHANNITLQNILNNDLISVTDLNATNIFTLKDFKSQNDLTQLADGSGSSADTFVFPDTNIMLEGNRNFKLVNLGIATKSMTNKDSITNKSQRLTLSKIIMLKDSIGPFDIQSQISNIKTPAPYDLAFILKPSTEPHITQGFTIYPQTIYTGNVLIDSPYGKITSNLSGYWDIKTPIQTNYNHLQNTDHALLNKLNLKEHLRISIDMLNHYIDLVETNIDVDHQLQLDTQAKQALQMFIAKGLVKIDKTDYLVNLTVENGMVKLNGINIMEPDATPVQAPIQTPAQQPTTMVKPPLIQQKPLLTR